MENITIEELIEIYEIFQDDLSKSIFTDRLAFSLGEGHKKANS